MEMDYIARFHARPGHEAAVVQAILEVTPQTRQEAGCLSVHAFRSLRDPQSFFVHSTWRDEATFDAHARMPYTEAFVARIEALIDHAWDGARTERIA